LSDEVSWSGGASVGRSGLFAIRSWFPGTGSLTITGSGMTFRMWSKRYQIDRADVSGIRQYKPVFWFMGDRGVQILHTRRDYPRFMLFLTPAPELVLAEFRRLGFPVLDEASNAWKDLNDSMG
jgi:hypothetical protein